MRIYNYSDLIVNLELIGKLFYIVYLFFVKGGFFLYFILVMFCQFNTYLFLIAYNFFNSSLVLVHLLNIEFTYIQYFHILLKLLKVYVFMFLLFKFLNNIKIFKFNTSVNTLLFFFLIYLYLLTGSFWSWLEPSWTSWWFGEDIEELLIFVIFLNFVILLHYLGISCFTRNLLMYSFFLLFLGYVGNLIIFTSRHKSLSYYSIVNINFWFLIFLFSFRLEKTKFYWYMFDFSWKYNWFIIYLLNKKLTKLTQLYVYIFDIFFFYTYIIYESPIFFKFISNYINFYFFLPNVTNNDLIYILILNFFILLNKIKIFYFYLIFSLDWDIFLNSIIFFNATLSWNVHLFFINTYLIDLTLNNIMLNNLNYSTPAFVISNFYITYLLNVDLNSIWLFYDNILNIDNLQLITAKDLLYFFFIFSLIFFFSLKLI